MVVVGRGAWGKVPHAAQLKRLQGRQQHPTTAYKSAGTVVSKDSDSHLLLCQQAPPPPDFNRQTKR